MYVRLTIPTVYILSHKNIFIGFNYLQSVKIMHYSVLHLKFFIFIPRWFDGPRMKIN